MQYASLAIAHDLPVESLKTIARGHHYLDPPRRFHDIIFQIYLEGALTEAQAESLARDASHQCFAENTLGRGIPVTTEVHLNGSKVLTLRAGPEAK